jgi:hypothetical protein
MDSAERQRKIESYGRGYAQLVEALSEFPQEMWHFHSPDDPWSIHQIVVHITDSEANSYIRCRRCLAEPGKSVMAYDEYGWSVALRYQEQDAQEALELFKWLRLRSYTLIRSLPDFAWTQTMEHPQQGTMTLDDWLDVYEGHIPDHIEQMQRIYQAWRSLPAQP